MRRVAVGRSGVLAISLLLHGLWCEAGLAAEATATPVEPATAEPSSAAPVTIPAGVPSLQMSTDYSSPVLSIGSYRPVGQIESTGVRITPFVVRAGLNSGLGYNDNVTLARINKISSVFLSVSPSVAVGLERGGERYYVIYRGNYGRYFSSSADDFAEHNIGLSAAHEWSGRLRTSLLYEHVRGQDARGATTTAVTESDKWYVNALRGTATYGADGAQGRLQGDAAYVSKSYTSNLSSAFREYEQYEVGGVFYYRLAPKTQALVEIRRTDITHKLDPLLDSIELRYLVGAAWEATANTSGSFRVGYMTKDAENPAVSNFSAPAYEASIAWQPLVYSRIDFTARRSFSEPVEVGSDFLVDNFVSATWTHAWGGGIRSTAGYVYGRQSHEGLSRTDTYQGFDVKASYALGRRVRVGAEFRHDMRSSPLPDFDFKRNLTLFTVETAL